MTTEQANDQQIEKAAELAKALSFITGSEQVNISPAVQSNKKEENNE